MKAIIKQVLTIGAAFFLIGSPAYGDERGIDYPHCTSYNLSCLSCHYMAYDSPPAWVSSSGIGDDTPYNNLCLSCHNGTVAPNEAPHSSSKTSARYGDWHMECRRCHWPHQQMQLWKSDGYGGLIASEDAYVDLGGGAKKGVSTAISATTLTMAGANWTNDQFNGYILIPNVGNRANSSDLSYAYSYKIIDTTSDTITVAKPMNLDVAHVGDTFAIYYGKLIKNTLPTANSGDKTVRLFRDTGANSFADGDTTYDGVCEVCHTKTTHFRNDGSGSQPKHENVGGGQQGTDCMKCHAHINGFAHGGGGGGGGADGSGCGSATTCHGTVRAHTTHVSGAQLSIACIECHKPNEFPNFQDGATSKDTTTVCNNCHSANGVALAKQYWAKPGSNTGAAGSWAVVEGEKSYCGSCHDDTPGKVQVGGVVGASAFNVVGNDTTYGFYVTGHGKPAGNYARLSFQPTAGAGNPAANKKCSDCHDGASAHFNNAGKRLKAGYENNQANANCNQCHEPVKGATHDPQFYTTSAAYENSAHSTKLCTECHDVHGTVAGAFPAMTLKNQETLCADCHSNGGHPGVGTKSFSIGANNYTLECVLCHNVHVVTGTYAQADQNKSPVTRITDITNVWGDTAGEKMNAYAGSGTYRTPNGDSFSGAQLPDYPSFCLDCHGTSSSGSVYFGINWDSDNHGRASANEPNGYGTCPNWFACGNAFGWDNDDCIGTQSQCWPVIPRGAGDQLYSREPYTHTERIAGANFTLSCTDCHTGHGTGSLCRTTVNGGAFQGQNWNNQCNRCHYYYSDWHAGMSCGNASCHVSDRMNQTGTNSLHAISHQTGSGATRPAHTPGLVFSYSFENNLKDSSGFELDGKWYSAAGSFAAGKSGQAAVLSQGKTVQVGTENAYWSTDAGYHGTWVYTEMKYNTTLEAWVYPTDNAKNEYTIFNKHVGVSNNGGYSFSLKNINGTLRATFNMAADNNGFTQDGRAGVRGAFSSVAIPLNTWTHVAATFDTAGPDRNASDPTVGRIRIYVNGEDKTTSSIGGIYRQPGAGETSIYAYSENSPWNQGICYNGSWCASEFSIGGFDWETTNFVGMIDEAKVWNTTKDAAYFEAYDSQSAPYISTVEGNVGSNQLSVTFSEGVYTNSGPPSGALVAGDFTLTDTDNGRTITGVSHNAGSATAVLTLSSALDATTDIGVDTLAAKSNAIYDDHNNPAGTTAVTITTPVSCPAGTVTFNLNEASGSAYVSDSSGILVGAVAGGAATLTGSAYSGGGDGSGRYIDFENSDICLQATTAMTLEARIKPTGIPDATATNYVRRILARDGGGNYQLSLWRNNSVSDQDPPDKVVMAAFWVLPENNHGGNAWKVLLTDFNTCKIVNDHWYQIKAVWDSSIIGGIPVKIYIDDQGANGDDVGQNWAGYIDCSDSDQSEMPAISRIWEGDVISPGDGDFLIGANVSNHANNLFNGLIDWITWKNTL